MIVRAADSKKVYQIDLIPKEKIIALLCGRNRHVHLHSWGALEGAESAFDIKLTETKGCQALTTGVLRPGGPACLLAAAKRQVRILNKRTRPYTWSFTSKPPPPHCECGFVSDLMLWLCFCLPSGSVL